MKHNNHSVLGITKPMNPKLHFINQQCFLDVQLSCHFIILLICHFYDKYLHLKVPINLTNSDFYEVFFLEGIEGWRGCMISKNYWMPPILSIVYYRLSMEGTGLNLLGHTTK